MPLGTEVNIGPGHTVLDGDPALPKGALQPPPQFSAHVHRGQTAGCLRIPLEVGLGPGDIVLDGDPAPPRKGALQPPPFGQRLLPNGRPSRQLLSSCFASIRRC